MNPLTSRLKGLIDSTLDIFKLTLVTDAMLVFANTIQFHAKYTARLSDRIPEIA